MRTLRQYIAEYMTPDNLREYAQTQDKLLFIEYLTDLPMGSKMLERLDLAFWKSAIDQFMIESI
jgi:hypothetical protein